MKHETYNPPGADTNFPEGMLTVTAPQEKLEALKEITRTIKAKDQLTKVDSIFLILRELMEVKK